MVEFVAFLWGGFLLLIYGLDLIVERAVSLDYLAGACVFAVIPLTFGLLHRRIRLERAKGGDALYRKRLATNR